MKQKMETAVDRKHELIKEDVVVRPFRSTAVVQQREGLSLHTKLRAGNYTDCYGTDKGVVEQCCHDNGKKDVFKAEDPAYIAGYQYYCDATGPDYGTGDWD